MYYFVDFEHETISNDTKGRLFEKFVGKLIEILGFENIDIRYTKQGAEYDVRANQKLNENEKIVGQAKAYTKKLNIDVIKSFIGSMTPYWEEEDNKVKPVLYTGLLISISDMTPQATEFFNERKVHGRRIKSIAGEEIINLISQKSINYQNLSKIKNKSELETNLRSGETYFCISDRGQFFIQLLIPREKTLPKFFQVYSDIGDNITERDFLLKIKQKIPELSDLEIYGTIDEKSPENDVSIRNFLKFNKKYEQNVGQGWFDYKLPVAPPYFIGRKNELNSFSIFLDNIKNEDTRIKIFQILSRSGVGKSSFLYKAKSLVDSKGLISIFWDCRDIRNTLDLIAFTQHFSEEINQLSKDNVKVPITLKDCIDFFETSNQILKNKHIFGVLFLDQFEGLAVHIEKFDELFDFFFEISQVFSNIILVIARKSDVIRPLDEDQIDLTRLTAKATTITLNDFDKKEAIILIKKMGSNLTAPISFKLKQMILERSSGFPWLHKRICAHILKLYQEGNQTQEDIIRSGLLIEDMFNEEFAQLDELDLGFLKNLVEYLPSNLDTLQDKFPNTPNLQYFLGKLINLRIIRLSGKVIDTYNDFIKEYIQTGRIPPPLDPSYILKKSPNEINKWFQKIIKKNNISYEDIIAEEGMSLTSL